MTDTLTSQLEHASPAAAPTFSPPAAFPRLYRFGPSPTLTLSLTSGYAPHWTKREGVRELVQNWYDGCNANLRSVNQRITATSTAATPASLYSLSISRSSSAGHSLYQATAVHASRPSLHLGSILQHSSSSTLCFHNNGVSLSRSILLLGHSSKRGEAAGEGMVGSFGEGMKVGMLALLREGCSCWMGTRGEVWQFGFYQDSNYGETLLGVWTNSEQQHHDKPAALDEQHDEDEHGKARREQEQEEWDGLTEQQQQERHVLRSMLDQRKLTDTSTVLTGISADDWSAFQHDFLFLSSTDPSTVVTTPLGSILLATAHQHCLYVKGFLVASFPNDLVYGVDLKEAKLDRDRKAVLQTSELHRLVGSMWAQAASQQPELLERYFELLLHHSSSAEAKHAEYYLTSSIVENVASTFFALHGHDSQPVLNSSGDDAVFISTQLSRRPVLVPAALYEILTRSSRIQPVDELLSQHHSRTAPQLALSSLSPQQLHCLQSAVRLVQTLAPLFSMDDVAVTSFADDEGAWCKEEEVGGSGGRVGKVLLDSRCLDIDKVHHRWGDCGVEERRVQEGKGRGVKAFVAASECSCREAAIAALLIKETRRVRWRNGPAAVVAAAASGGESRAEKKRGGDAIMEHLARGRESELLMVNLLERTLRRGEKERLRRQALDEEKQLVIQHLRRSTDNRERLQPSSTAARDVHGQHEHSEQSDEAEEKMHEAHYEEKAEHEQRDMRLLSLQHEVELLRADVSRQQQLSAQQQLDAQSRERLLHSAIAELSGQAVDGVTDSRLRELEKAHLSALGELQRVREERRRKVQEAEDERRKRAECGVCMSRTIDCVLLPCRHASVCSDCARQMDKCGVCRKRIDDRIQYFG